MNKQIVDAEIRAQFATFKGFPKYILQTNDEGKYDDLINGDGYKKSKKSKKSKKRKKVKKSNYI